MPAQCARTTCQDAMTLASRLDDAVKSLPQTYPGPGGACAVLRDGEILVRHAWGFANAERHIRFTPASLFRMCSITKQFTCAAVLAACGDPRLLDAAIAARLPALREPAPNALHLAHNQSGLRDYWAVAMLHGAPVEAPFGDAESARVIGATTSLQFTPGTRYAYCNQNFRLLSDALEDHTGRGFAEHLRRIFARAGMGSAFLAAETASMPDGSTGYEGSQATGFRAAVNNILWTGDAGLGASLDDMIAWERFIDATRDDPDSLYQRLSAPVSFADGAPAQYGFGLGRRGEFGRAITGHGGALRGWRSHRLYVPAERVSVVVMFNHLADAQGAAMDLLAAVLEAHRPLPEPIRAPDWLGAYQEPQTGLSARIEYAGLGQLRLRFGHGPELLDLQPDGSAGQDGTRLVPVADGIEMIRPAENQRSRLTRCAPAVAGEGLDAAGAYRCAELDATLTITDAGGVLYGALGGFLGAGRAEKLDPIAADLWALPCPRALDHTPPGDWTLAVQRDAGGAVSAIQLGCWLARGLTYARVDRRPG